MKKNKILKNLIIKSLLICLIGTFSFFTFSAFDENIQIKQEINDFKKNSSFYCYSKKYNTNFYIVSNENFPINSPSFTIVDEEIYPGYNGDILCSLKNEHYNKIVSSLFSFYFGGHAALVCNGQKLFQTTGYSPTKENYATYDENNWLYNHDIRFNFVGLKINATQQEKDLIVKESVKLQYKPYNFLFIFNNKNAYYCTDLIERLYKEYTKVNLNEDDVIVSVQDIIVSSYSSIFLYKELNPVSKENRDNKLGDYNMYFLDDGNDYFAYLSK